jgi:hypothetical protein
MRFKESFISLAILLMLFASTMIGQMPAPQARYQLVVVGQPDSYPVRWFSDNPDLANVRKAVDYQLFTPGQKIYQERYAAVLGDQYPIVAYLRPDGGAIYVADRNTMPKTSNDLFAAMKAAALQAQNARPANQLPNDLVVTQETFEDCPDGYCPTPNRDEPRFPRLQPLINPSNPLELGGGVVRDSISSGVWLVFAAITLCFIAFFGVIIFGAMVVVARWVVK